MTKPAIQIWRFYDAPEEYQALSPHGGDEDWLAFVPKEYTEDYMPWMESGSSFGCCDVSTFKFSNGDEIRIGAHA